MTSARPGAVLARPWLVGLGVGLVAVWPLVGALHADFVDWDDGISIYENPHIRNLEASSIRWMFTDLTYNPRFMPLTWLGWAVTYRFFGLDPLPYHLGNLALHALNAVLLFHLLRALLRQTRAASPEGISLFAAAVGALFWAIHPLRAEPVAWATDRSYEQALFFALMSAGLYLDWASRQAAPRPAVYWASVVAFCLSVLSYPVCLGFAVVPFVLDFYPLRRLRAVPVRWLRLLLEKVPFVAAAALSVVMTLVSRVQADASSGLGPMLSLQESGLFSRAMKALYLWTYYVWRPLVPVNLSPVYTDLLDYDPWSAPFLGSAALVALVTLLAVRWRHKAPGLASVWGCHLVLLAPVLGVTERLAYSNDRYCYVEGICWGAVAMFLVHTALLASPTRAQTLGVGLGCAALLGSLGVMTLEQTRAWEDSGTLFTRILGSLGEDTYRYNIYWRLGRHYLDHGNREKALEGFSRTLEGIPRHFQASDLRGLIELQDGASKAAVADFRNALTTREDAEVRVHLGLALEAEGQLSEAIEQFQRAIALKPDSFLAHRNLAVALAAAGRRDEGAQHAMAAVRLNPRDGDARKLLEELSAPRVGPTQ